MPRLPAITQDQVRRRRALDMCLPPPNRVERRNLMPLPYGVDQALNEVDAAVFSSDCFHEREDLDTFKDYLSRWNRAVEAIEKDAEELETLVDAEGEDDAT